MPKEIERKLRRAAERKGWSEEREDRYVYGALRKMSWKPERERRRRGGDK